MLSLTLPQASLHPKTIHWLDLLPALDYDPLAIELGIRGAQVYAL
jgi:hypothetical protein